MKYTNEQLKQIEEYGELDISIELIHRLLLGKSSSDYVKQLIADISVEGTAANSAYMRGKAQRELKLKQALFNLGLGEATERNAYEAAVLSRRLDDIIKENFGLE